jgi:phage gpG-like protein
MIRRGDFNIKGLIQKLNQLKSNLPIFIANDVENHFLDGFRKGGGQTDAGMWRPRRGDRDSGDAILVKSGDLRADISGDRDSGRAILVKSGDLRADIKRREVNFKRIVVGTRNIAYAAVHNEGGRAGRGRGFTMLKREFIGKSRILECKIKFLIENELKKVKP